MIFILIPSIWKRAAKQNLKQNDRKYTSHTKKKSHIPWSDDALITSYNHLFQVSLVRKFCWPGSISRIACFPMLFLKTCPFCTDSGWSASQSMTENQIRQCLSSSCMKQSTLDQVTCKQQKFNTYFSVLEARSCQYGQVLVGPLVVCTWSSSHCVLLRQKEGKRVSLTSLLILLNCYFWLVHSDCAYLWGTMHCFNSCLCCTMIKVEQLNFRFSLWWVHSKSSCLFWDVQCIIVKRIHPTVQQSTKT